MKVGHGSLHEVVVQAVSVCELLQYMMIPELLAVILVPLVLGYSVVLWEEVRDS